MSDSSGFSRRDLLGGAGMTAGALAAFGATLPMLGGSALAQAAAMRTTTSTGLALEVDGAFVGFLTGASGGGFSATRVLATTGVSSLKAFGISRFTQTPVSITFTSGMSGKAIDWFTARNAQQRSVAVLLYEAGTFLEIYRLALGNAWVREFSMVGVDGASKDALEFSVTFDAEESKHIYSGRKSKLLPGAFKATKQARANLFRMFVQGLESSTQMIRQIGALTMKRDILTESGTSRLQTKTAGMVEFGTVEAIIGLDSAGPLYQWLGDQAAGKPAERPGELQLLAIDGKPIATISFPSLRPLNVSSPFDGGSGDGVPVVKIELLASEMTFNLKELGG